MSDHTASTITIPTAPLTAADRCDRCSAAAKVRAVLGSGGELLFCRHHFNANEASLIQIGASVTEG